MHCSLTEWLGDETVGSSLSSIRTTNESVQRRSARTVRHGDGSGELDEVGCGHVAVLLEWANERDHLIETNIGVELCLDIREDHDGTICTSTAVAAVLSWRNLR